MMQESGLLSLLEITRYSNYEILSWWWEFVVDYLCERHFSLLFRQLLKLFVEELVSLELLKTQQVLQ